MVATDLVALPLCFFVALMLRHGGFKAATHYDSLPYLLVLGITIPVFIKTGLYRAVIRFIDQRLLTTTGMGLAVAILCAYLVEYWVRGTQLPRTALVIYWFIAFAYVTTSRLLVRRLLKVHQKDRRKNHHIVGIYGAAEPGAQLARAMWDDERYCPVCFFDEKSQFVGQTVAGLKVYPHARLAELTEKYGINLIVMAVPAASATRLRELVHDIHAVGIDVKIFNDLTAPAQAKVSTSSIRELKVEDLLGRDPVPPQPELFAQCVETKSVLVTGAGGSIGSELCRQIATLAPSALHLLDHSEYALYTIQRELHAVSPSLRIVAHLGSVCDKRLVERILRDTQIDTIYHAAAYKHVPLVEANIAEGLLNNVIGAQVIAAAAEQYGVSTCVLVSTDKAVRPTNIMGASKRIAELIFQAAAEQTLSDTTFCMVRFGNVLGSSGSVVPLFKQQIEQGGPITITHPDVIRYFMLIPEAAQLVIQAGAMAKGGDVFVLDMGKPVRIVDLARSMLEAAGLTEKTQDNPRGDIEIRFIGLRPGEKLYEELLIGENASASAHPRIMCANEHKLEAVALEHLVKSLVAACEENNRDKMLQCVKLLVREYGPEIAKQRDESSQLVERESKSLHAARVVPMVQST
ncbi:polysaccharide biosynthesis protein [Noviherbaspirillum malthae]|uniref:polysaccharide biosynthesis protein n=1 Tax=Noviherbaspirillum malthae TaxID=1260987 RepID=UPI00188F8236|nr:nucleoside-diphosphate sugar epimerase/dehydratase [Noviherbaspirillum malthae]